MKELGVRFEFQAERAFQFGRNYSDGELDDALLRLAELDHAIKGGSRLAPELELQRALVDLTQKHRALTTPPGSGYAAPDTMRAA